MNTIPERTLRLLLIRSLAICLWLLVCGATAHAQGQAPPPPTGLSYTIAPPVATSSTSWIPMHPGVILRWNPSPGADYYTVFEAQPTPNSPWSNGAGQDFSTSSTQAFAAGLDTPGYYRVVAINQYGSSTSAPLRFFLHLPPPTLSVAVQGSTAHLTWSKDPNDDYFYVLHGTTPGGPYSLMVIDETACALDVPVGDTPSYFVVQGAMGYAGVSTLSNEVEAKAEAPAPTALVQACSTADTTLSNTPRYFSGTNCQASGDALAVDGWVQSAQLLIGGTVVNSYTDDGSHKTDVVLRAYFDSTHFSDNASVKVEMRVVNSEGRSCDIPLSTQPTAKNMLYALANMTLPETAEECMKAAVSHATSVNYSTNGGGSDHDGKLAILRNLPLYTAFYARTHANLGIFEDCICQGGSYATANNIISAKEIMTAVSGKTQFPVYNFAFLDGCFSAGNGSPDETTANSFGISSGDGDRAYIGWQNESSTTEHNAEWTARVWEYLSQGQDVLDAVMNSTDQGNPEGPVLDYPVPIINELVSITPVILGDPLMKLHGVYTGTSASQWFRSVPLP